MKLIGIVTGILLLGSVAAARADTLTVFTLSNVVFSDKGTATGSFTLDSTTNKITSFNITTTNNPNPNAVTFKNVYPTTVALNPSSSATNCSQPNCTQISFSTQISGIGAGVGFFVPVNLAYYNNGGTAQNLKIAAGQKSSGAGVINIISLTGGTLSAGPSKTTIPALQCSTLHCKYGCIYTPPTPGKPPVLVCKGSPAP